MLFDTHAHLDDKRFDQDRDELIRRPPGQGVFRVICPGIDVESSQRCIELSERYDIVYAGVGVSIPMKPAAQVKIIWSHCVPWRLIKRLWP